MKQQRFARWVFSVAGIYGLLVLLPQYFMEEKIGQDYPPPLTHPEHFYGFIGVALAWQVVFLIIGRDPVRFRLLMIPAVLEKLAFGVPAWVLYTQGRVAPAIVLFGSVDLLLATFFIAAFRATGKTPQSE